MSGSWRGEYSYDAAGLPPVPFNAELIDVDGRVEGRSDEPNTFGAPGADRLFATLEGSRSGHTVRFVKTYDGSGGQTHAIAYEGRLSADGLRIEGRWRINFMAGAFFMEREPPAVAETAEPRAAEAEG